MSHYIHNIPGRLRIRSQELKNNPALLDEVQNCFAAASGIEDIKVSAVTGSVLIRYNPDRISPQQILGVLDDCEYVDVRRAQSLDAKLTSALSATTNFLGRAGLSMFVDRAFKGTGLSLLAAII